MPAGYCIGICSIAYFTARFLYLEIVDTSIAFNADAQVNRQRPYQSQVNAGKVQAVGMSSYHSVHFIEGDLL